jgi:hypothetical protein
MNLWKEDETRILNDQQKTKQWQSCLAVFNLYKSAQALYCCRQCRAKSTDDTATNQSPQIAQFFIHSLVINKK